MYATNDNLFVRFLFQDSSKDWNIKDCLTFRLNSEPSGDIISTSTYGSYKKYKIKTNSLFNFFKHDFDTLDE